MNEANKEPVWASVLVLVAFVVSLGCAFVATYNAGRTSGINEAGAVWKNALRSRDLERPVSCVRGEP